MYRKSIMSHRTRWHGGVVVKLHLRRNNEVEDRMRWRFRGQSVMDCNVVWSGGVMVELCCRKM